MELSSLLQSLIGLMVASFTLIYFLLRKHFSYWADRGVVHENPVLFYGNLREFGRSKSFSQLFRDFYTKFKGQAAFGGYYLYMQRAVVILDLDLVKSVMVKDFNYFANRGNYYNERDDPLSANLINLDGPKWRKLRNKLTPAFSSGKIKLMLPAVVQVAELFVEVLRAEVTSTSDVCIEVNEFMGRFTTDIIGSCAFGIECNSLRDKDDKFRLMARKAVTGHRHGYAIFAFMRAFPDLARKLGLRATPEDVHQFFMGVVRETVEYRERTQLKRNDFLDLLLDLKRNDELEGLTLEQISAQVFVFFLAGLESVSKSIAFCLYELALNSAIQDRARTEINEVFQRHNGVFTYECMRELKYLHQIIQEALRRYTSSTILVRQAVNDYPIPNTRHVIEKGTVIIVPADAIHHDADIYTQPEVFDPERFTAAELEKRNSMAWLPFGEGPRNCIAMRFGEMEMLVGLAMLLKYFRFSPAPHTPLPLKFETKSFMLTPKGGIDLRVKPV